MDCDTLYNLAEDEENPEIIKTLLGELVQPLSLDLKGESMKKKY